MHLTPHERVIGWRLTEGHYVGIKELTEAFYANDPDGGALWAEQCIRKYICDLRAKMANYGITVHNHYGHGYYILPHQIDAMRTILADEIARNVIPLTRHGGGLSLRMTCKRARKAA